MHVSSCLQHSSPLPLSFAPLLCVGISSTTALHILQYTRVVVLELPLRSVASRLYFAGSTAGSDDFFFFSVLPQSGQVFFSTNAFDHRRHGTGAFPWLVACSHFFEWLLLAYQPGVVLTVQHLHSHSPHSRWLPKSENLPNTWKDVRCGFPIGSIQGT